MSNESPPPSPVTLLARETRARIEYESADANRSMADAMVARAAWLAARRARIASEP